MKIAKLGCFPPDAARAEDLLRIDKILDDDVVNEDENFLFAKNQTVYDITMQNDGIVNNEGK